MNCPVDDVELEFLQEAISHDNYSQFARPGRCDGYFTREQFSERVPGNGEPQLCKCSAHSAIFSTEYPTDVFTDIKELIHSPPCMVIRDVVYYSLTPKIVQPVLNRWVRGDTSWTKLRYELRPVEKQSEVPLSWLSGLFFVVLKEEFGAMQILICMGEIQSTSDPDTQNSIYAVGLF